MTTVAQRNYTPHARRLLDALGHQEIRRIQVVRQPIKQIYEVLLNILSALSWSQLKAKYGYETFFHLSLLIQIGGRNYTLEKNSVLEITQTQGLENEAGVEIKQVPMTRRNITFGELIGTTRHLMGDQNFFGYEALSTDGRTIPNNCQTFVMAVLRANYLLTPDLKEWIFQDMEHLAAELPDFTKRISKAITDLASLLNSGVSHVQNALGYKEGGEVKFTSQAREIGGKVPVKGIPKKLRNQDCVKTILTPGELVINKKNVPLVEKFLRSKGIILPGMRRVKG